MRQFFFSFLLLLAFANITYPGKCQQLQYFITRNSLDHNIDLQNKFDETYFAAIDSFARTVKYTQGLYPMTNVLTQQYAHPVEKLRSIFTWITQNIRYDCAFLNGPMDPKGFECDGDSITCAKALLSWEMKYINRVLKKKKGICQGYSMLLKKMCDIAGIECEIITGYAKTKPFQVGNPFGADHAWNAVRIDGVYYFLDATWAAGFCPKCVPDKEWYCKFIRSYNNYYWLTPFNKLVRDHYPSKGKWVMEPNYTKEKFFNNTFFYGQYALQHIDLLSPGTGVIEARVGDTIHFRFNYTGAEIQKIQANTNIFRNPSIDYYERYGKKEKKLKWVHDTTAIKKQVYLPFRKTGNLYEVDYVVTSKELYVIDILFDRKYAMKFKVKVQGK